MKRLIDIGFSDMKEMYENMAKEMEAVKKELDRLSKYKFIPFSLLSKPNHNSSIEKFKLCSWGKMQPELDNLNHYIHIITKRTDCVVFLVFHYIYFRIFDPAPSGNVFFSNCSDTLCIFI